MGDTRSGGIAASYNMGNCAQRYQPTFNHSIRKTTMNQPKLLDTVALLKPVPAEQLILVEPEYASVNLPVGLVGTIVEVYDREDGNHFLIEFSDSDGCEYAMATLQTDGFLVLKHDLAEADRQLASVT